MSLADRHLSHRLAAKYGTGGRLGWQSAALNEHAEEKYRKERKKYEDETAKLFEKLVNGEDISK